SFATGLVDTHRVVLIGDAIDCAEYSNRLKGTGIRAVGSFPFPGRHDTAGNGDSSEDADQDIHALIDGCRRLKPDDILILAKHEDLTLLTSLIGSLSGIPAGLHVVQVESAALLAAARIVEFGNTITMQVLRPPLSQLQQAAKRVFDVVVAAAGLVILSPLLTIVAIAVKLDSPGPVLFRQTRHGYNNETIKDFKFRSMMQ